MTSLFSPSKLFVFFALAIGLAGCQLAPKAEKEDSLAAERSKAYLDSVDLVTPSELSGSPMPCIIPASVEKPFTPGNQTTSNRQSKDWRILIEHAKTCVAVKNWKTLEALGNAIARLDLDSPWGAYFLSLAAEGSGDYQRALWMTDLAQKKAGGRSGLYFYQKGRILYALKEVGQAMKMVKTALGLEPKLAEGHFFLAEIHRRDLEDKLAMAEYQAVLSVNPNHFESLMNLGEMKLAQNSGDEAAGFFSRAVKARPEQLNAWIRLAYVYETVKKDPGLALATYRDLKTSISAGSVRKLPDFDLTEKIKSLESLVQARLPAQASTLPIEKTKSVK